MHKEMIIILGDIRSSYNVGSIFRTADAVGVKEIVCCGITPYPRLQNDLRPERVITNNSKEIHKTALDAENSVAYSHYDSTLEAIKQYSKQGLTVIALENKVPNTQNIFEYQNTSKKIVLVLGSETDGLSQEVLKHCDGVVEIPMRGVKNSLNVSVAAGIALYTLLSN